MKKILFVASTTGHIKSFHTPYLAAFKKIGYCVDIIGNLNREPLIYDNLYDIKIHRHPLNSKNIIAYKSIKHIIKNGSYDIIHCHTPVAAMMTRLAARKMRKKGTRVIYTAHGFHFFKGAPIKNWLMYFPVEWLCSFLTDTLITINQEDFAFAKKHLHAKQTEYIHGVGVNVEKFKNTEVNREEKREELGIPKDSIAVLSVGELNDNKNHETVLKAIAKLDRKDIIYIICGKGNKKEYLENLAAELGMSDRLILAGFRNDVAEIYKCCDIFAFPSKREGLGLAALEAMAAGLPIVGSNIHGIKDYLINSKTGFKCEPLAIDTFAENISTFVTNKEMRNKIGHYNMKYVENFNLEQAINEMKQIYNI